MKKIPKVIGAVLLVLLLGVMACGQQPKEADAPATASSLAAPEVAAPEGATAPNGLAVEPAGPEQSDTSTTSQEPVQAAATAANDGSSVQPSVDKVAPTDVSTADGGISQAVAPQFFFLLIIEPQHDAVVTDPSMQLSGRTGTDAVVSVNGVSAEVDGLGAFVTAAQLEPGPNIIDVVATSPEGEVISSVIAVIYRPTKTG